MAISEQTANFVRDFYALVDAGKMDEYLEIFAEDARVIMGNNPPLEGRRAIRDGLSQMLSNVTSSKHESRHIWEPEENLIVTEVSVSFSRRDGQVVRVPGTVIFEVRDGLIAEERAFVDMTPVFA